MLQHLGTITILWFCPSHQSFVVLLMVGEVKDNRLLFLNHWRYSGSCSVLPSWWGCEIHDYRLKLRTSSQNGGVSCHWGFGSNGACSHNWRGVTWRRGGSNKGGVCCHWGCWDWSWYTVNHSCGASWCWGFSDGFLGFHSCHGGNLKGLSLECLRLWGKLMLRIQWWIS